MASSSSRRAVAAIVLLVLPVAVAPAFGLRPRPCEPAPEARRKIARKSREVRREVASAAGPGTVVSPAVAPSERFSPAVRLGFTMGDQWEPAIAADARGTVVVLYTQYFGVPGCNSCPSPTMVLVVSRGGGATWDDPVPLFTRVSGAGSTPGTGQWDPQITVDPLDQSFYACWLHNEKSEIVVARSTDRGATWTGVLASSTKAPTDKPILVARGGRVHVAYNHSNRLWFCSCEDFGRAPFVSTSIAARRRIGWSLATGGAIGSDGTVWFGWGGYTQNGGAKGPVNLYLARKLPDRDFEVLPPFAVSGSPPDCAEYSCGWAYLGAQVALACDAAGTLYALWNASEPGDAGAPARMWFARSTDRGASWSPPQDVTEGRASIGVHHGFPAIAAGAAGDVRIAWMDARETATLPSGVSTAVWNTYYQASADGGATWDAEADIATPATGYSYIFEEGFSFPFGDYFEVDIDEKGRAHVVWGQALNYDSPGSIWYARGR